jgi:hypothetical protein
MVEWGIYTPTRDWQPYKVAESVTVSLEQTATYTAKASADSCQRRVCRSHVGSAPEKKRDRPVPVSFHRLREVRLSLFRIIYGWQPVPASQVKSGNSVSLKTSASLTSYGAAVSGFQKRS